LYLRPIKLLRAMISRPFIGRITRAFPQRLKTLSFLSNFDMKEFRAEF
jgi:hypothetical protein